ncbi:MAG: DUF3108 domain-containing protein [Pseudomonadota bacterium]
MKFARKAIAAVTVSMGLIGGAAGAAPASPAVLDGIDHIYDFYLGGVKAGELTMQAKLDGSKYRATSVLRTAGVVGLVYRAAFEARATGRLNEGRLAPRKFTADSRMKKKKQYVEMTYQDDAPGAIKAVPKFQPKPWQIEPTEQSGTLDPISAALTALAPTPVASMCNTSVEVFDGRKRYAIDLGAPVADGKRIRCPATYRRIAGFKPKMMRKERRTWPFDIWYEERKDGLAQVVRAGGETPFGLAVILLRQN